MPHIITDDGVRLNYRLDDYRDPWLGEPDEAVLLHHGFTKSLEFWTPFVPSIARRHRVVRYDVRGAGRSSVPPPASAWTADRLVRDALNLTDALGIRKVHWAGFESGGIIGLLFAAQHSERAASVACFNTPYRSRESEAQMQEHFRCGFASYDEAIDTLGVAGWLAKRRAQEGASGKGNPAFLEWVAAQAATLTPSVAKGWHRIFERTSDILSEVAPRVDVPVLLVAGANLGDFRKLFGCEPALLEGLRRMLRCSRKVVYVPGVGAHVQTLGADACAAAYLDFLARLGKNEHGG